MSSGQIRIAGAGEATITATVPENGNYSTRPQASQTLMVGKAAQSITFNAPAEVDRNAGTVPLDVSASSGLPVSLSIDDEEVATLSETTLNILRLGKIGRGSCTERWCQYVWIMVVAVYLKKKK